MTLDESRAVFNAYAGRYRLRNQALHLLCVTTGLRVSEALSLRVADVMRKGAVTRRLTIRRNIFKGKKAGRVIDLPEPARAAIRRQVDWLLTNGHLGSTEWLFRSQYGAKPMSRIEAWKVFNAACLAAGLAEDLGALGTHSWRKTYAAEANRFFIGLYRDGRAINPMLETSRALGHRSIESTEKYLSFEAETQQHAVRYMEKAHAYGI